jgi:hypothetical protein
MLRVYKAEPAALEDRELSDEQRDVFISVP